ncbi:BLUF domain-containing protein [Paracoccus sp. 1_MG-2023]|uniref:BLUF domain-containing protein n=1 Tax=unclassified Paracoccus (in: a-proteobacteria) TaxID=2688777 RepID=UPI001C08D0E1|nr:MULTISPECIES: BLUF domain-containing protein [unclassified Paracoccus (in: a-proteobacteria)]MBU2957468.1 BLUF domain-containing protein [Paracoccus sp. C2R09]MDO6669666.1 BLUF domain-containing protein [Paracoccus sp. 1_MG-2023]
MTSDPDQDEQLAFLLYRSAASPDLGDEDLQRILVAARRRNEERGLTGCLHHEDGMFFQWLEGPQGPLAEVVAMIRDDPRHSELTILEQGRIAQRRFDDWRMRFSDRDSGSLMDWFAAIGGSTFNRGDYAGGVTSFLVSLSA